MNPHFCKVGKINAYSSKIISTKELERRISNFVDDVTKVQLFKKSPETF